MHNLSLNPEINLNGNQKTIWMPNFFSWDIWYILSLQSKNVKDLTDEEILYIIKNTCSKPEWLKAQAFIIDKAFSMTKKWESFWEWLNSFFIEFKMKYDFITNVYIEYYLRKLKSFEYEYMKLWLVWEDFQKIVSFQKIQLSQNSKIKVITNIVKLFLMKLDKWNNIFDIDEKLIKHFDDRFANQNISLEWLIEWTEIVVVGNNIQLICHNEDAKSFYELLFYNSWSWWFNSDTKLLGLWWNLNFTVILQKNYISSYNQDEQAHEFWHASDNFRSSLFWELFWDEKKSLYSLQSQGFYNNHYILSTLNEMLVDIDTLVNSSLGEMISTDNEIIRNQLKVQFELPAFIFWSIKKSGNSIISEQDKDMIARNIIVWYIFSSWILKTLSWFTEETRAMIVNLLLLGWFMKVFWNPIKDCINQFNTLSELRWNGTQALVELWMLPLKKWGIYVKKELKKQSKI